MTGIGYEEPEAQVGSARAEGAPLSPFGSGRNPDPCSLVIFGVTGDLTMRKLVPALYDLACHGVLPEAFTIVGYGRKPLDDGSFQAMLSQAIDEFSGPDGVDGSCCRRILRAPRYVQGAFDDLEGFRKLAATLDEIESHAATGGNRAFYLATPPSLFGTIIGESGLARRGAFDGAPVRSPGQGWTRLVIEKPFGRDLQTARDLNAFVDTVFDERQVYRIDHYLAKETVQNLIVFRFANGIFEPIWNRRYVDHVQITAAETLGVEHRGPYYEETGALRDMITPHLVQLFTLVAMEPPVAFGADAVRDEKVKVLRALHPIPPDRVDEYAVRGQYVDGIVDGQSVLAYRSEEEVSPTSQTETYAAVKLLIDNWRWQGVPFYLRTGKRMAKRVSEIAIQFKRAPFALFLAAGQSETELGPNVLVMRVQPDEGFSLSVESKVPGQEISLQTVEMEYAYGSTLNELPFSAYETVLIDLMEGDGTLFNRGDQVEEAWRAVGPLLEAWQTAPARGIPIYEAGSWGPEAADALIARDGRSWRQP
jgi:glucose-6-phosphate 1-dehydrogenase